MYRHILVAIDNSPTSTLALDEAIKLAKLVGAELRIVHAVDEVSVNWDVEYPYFTEFRDAMVRAGHASLDKAAAAASAAGLRADTHLIEIDRLGDRIPEAIAKDADAWPADLIVLGTHGRRGLSHVLLGSVAEGVVRVARKPVLLIRAQ